MYFMILYVLIFKYSYIGIIQHWIFVSKTYELFDADYYDSQTSDKSRYTVQTGGATISYSSDGVTITGTQAIDTLVKNTALTLPTNYVASVKLMNFNGDGTTKNYGGVCFDNLLIDFQSNKINYYKLSPLTSLGNTTYTLQQGDVLKVEMNNGTMKVYVNNVLKTTQTIANTGVYQHRTYKMGSNAGRFITAKDLIVKSL